MDRRIFISKNASEIEPYRSQFEELGYSVIGHSFLSFSAVEFKVQGDFDVIFFGSPRAVTFFLAGQSISRNKLIACVGGKTKELLESLGHEVVFVGEKSGEPKVVGEEFRVWLGSRRALFPVSDRSLRTVSSVIDDARKEEVVVYSTEVRGKLIEACEVYVFTSPSNVEGYLLENAVPKGSKVIAWGKSTEDFLLKSGINSDHCLEESGFEGLIKGLKRS